MCVLEGAWLLVMQYIKLKGGLLVTQYIKLKAFQNVSNLQNLFWKVLETMLQTYLNLSSFYPTATRWGVRVKPNNKKKWDFFNTTDKQTNNLSIKNGDQSNIYFQFLLQENVWEKFYGKLQ